MPALSHFFGLTWADVIDTPWRVLYQYLDTPLPPVGAVWQAKPPE